jgi:hypothetical protein
MKTKTAFYYPILCSALLAAGQGGALSATDQPDASGATMSREDTVLVTATASVEAINYAKREVSLKGSLGNTMTFTVDERVQRFNEIKVGDLVQADYYVSFAAELRKPTKQEMKNPITLLEGTAKAPAGTAPAAGGLRRYKVVTTIEGLDRPTRTITVRGPLGNYCTARVADPSRLPKMRIGDNIVVTNTEALAISLEKAQKHAAE